jgi:hypothetical protein
MKAISIKQPWAWAIFNGKPVENRTWYSHYRGELLIHASKKFDYDGYIWLTKNIYKPSDVPRVQDFEQGGFVGKVKMVDCVEYHPSPFFFGPWGFVFANVKSIDFIPYKGQQGIFNVPDEIIPL